MKTNKKTRAAKLQPQPRQEPAAGPLEKYCLQLYITGTSPRSIEAVNNLHALCEEYLAGRYDLEVIDLYQEPARAALGQVIASPTLVKQLPKPLLRVVGNLANREQLMIKLHLTRNPVPAPSPP